MTRNSAGEGLMHGGRRLVGLWLVAASALLVPVTSEASDVDAQAAERGREALTLRGHLKPAWKKDVYRLAGASWPSAATDPESQPAAYAAAFNERYGLHPAPYPNDGLPMGLRLGVYPDGRKSGVQIDCMICHGGSIGGQSYVGLGNSQLDLSLLFDDLTRADGRRMPPSTFVINSARGTNNAGMFSVVLLSLRNPDLSIRFFPKITGANLPEMDTPAWWLLRKKSTMYYDGRTPADSVRTNMQFLLGEKTLDQFKALEPMFRDIQAYFKSLRAPKYPFPIDRTRAERGRVVFEKTCVKCHGTYGEQESYPNVIVDLKRIGTDPARALGLTDSFVAHYNSTWFAQGDPVAPTMEGYQAPPLDGIWATAPYLHNGSVPTLATLLNSPSRPSRYMRPPSTDFANYDTANVGWKFEAVESSRTLKKPESRFLFDASRFGLKNGGHTFGDKLSDPERVDLIEYLKTL